MAFNQVNSLEYNEIKLQIKNYLKGQSEFSDYDFEGSSLTVLLDVLAYNTYYTAMNANLIVNENFLETAVLRENVVKLARMIGYTPKSARSASMPVNIAVQTTFPYPRTVTLAFNHEWTIRQVLDDTKILRFGRMPVYEESIDKLSGFVLRSDILMAASMDEWDKKLIEFKKTLLTIGMDDSVDLALETFLKSKVQILAVLDDFGGTAGIVTMEDAIETLLGEEIVDELDEHEDMRELAREQAGVSEEE